MLIRSDIYSDREGVLYLYIGKCDESIPIPHPTRGPHFLFLDIERSEYLIFSTEEIIYYLEPHNKGK